MSVSVSASSLISQLSGVTTITANAGTSGIVVSGTTANIYDVVLDSGSFSSSSHMPDTLVTADLSGLDITITSLQYMFYSCSNLTSVTFKSGITSVTNMQACFQNCTSLTTVSTIGNSVTNMYGCFYGCTSLTTAPTIPDGVTNMESCFDGCNRLTSVPIIPDSVTNMRYCFYNCSALTRLDLSNLDTSSWESSAYENAFYNDTMTVITGRNWTLGTSSTLGGATALTFIGVYGISVSNLRTQLLGITTITNDKTTPGITINGTTANIYNCVLSSGSFSSSLHMPDTLVTADLSGLDITISDLQYMFYGCSGLTSVTFKSGITSVRYMYNCFQECAALTTVNNIPDFAFNLSYCFYKCTSLVTAPTIPSSASDMSCCFLDCTSLVTAPTIPSSVTNIGSCFDGCTSLVTAPTIPSSVTNMQSCFNGCTSLTTVSSLPSSVTTMHDCFYNCTALTSLDLSNLDTTDWTTSAYSNAFYNDTITVDIGSNWTLGTSSTLGGATALTFVIPTPTISTQPQSKAVIKGLTTTLSVTASTSTGTLSYQWQNKVNDVWTDITGETSDEYTTSSITADTDFRVIVTATYDTTTASVTSDVATITTRLTCSCGELRNALYGMVTVTNDHTTEGITIDGTTINIYNVTVTDKVEFLASSTLVTIDLTGLILGPNVTSADNIFRDYYSQWYYIYNTSITSIDITGWDFSNVTSATNMFHYCTALTTVTADFDTIPNDINVSQMFYGCAALTTINGIEDLDTSNMTILAAMFSGCNALSSLNIANWNTSNIENTSYLFGSCTSLTSLDLSNWDTSNITDISSMFANDTMTVKIGPNWTLGTSPTLGDATALTFTIAAPVITTQPQSASIVVGNTANLSVVATAEYGTLSYQWQEDINNVWTDISGATSASYSFTVLNSAPTDYRCVVTNTLSGVTNTVNSNAATITSTMSNPTITTQPIGGFVQKDAPYTLSVTAATPTYGTLSYQWYKDDTLISGATARTYTIDSSTAGTYEYYCKVINTYEYPSGATPLVVITDSLKVGITVFDGLTIVRQPVNASIAFGSRYQFAVGAYSDYAISYQWYKCDDASKTNPVAVTNGNNPVLYGLSVVSGTEYYYCHVSDDSGAYIDTNVVTLTTGVNPDPTGLKLTVKGKQIIESDLIVKGFIGSSTSTLIDITNVTGYDRTKTQVLKNVQGTLTWVDE